MKTLTQLICAIPLDSFSGFLAIKTALDNPELKPMIMSLLATKAWQAGLDDKTVIDFVDPLQQEVQSFSRELEANWDADPAHQEKKIDEDSRLDCTVSLFANMIEKSFCDLPTLIQKINSLIPLYEQDYNGYMVNALTSLLASIMYVAENKFPIAESKPRDITSLPKESVEILSIYASLNSSEQLKLLYLLRQLECAYVAYKDKLELFIEDQIYPMVVVLANPYFPFDNFFETHLDMKNAFLALDRLRLLEACVYSKGKNAEDRLALLRKVYQEEQEKIIKIGYTDVDEAMKEFKNKMTSLLMLNDNYVTTFMRGAWNTIGFFSKSVSSYLPVGTEQKPEKEPTVSLK